MPAVSVVMPVYNGEEFLAPAIDSVLKQTFQDFELIVVDDGSTDGTRPLLDSYQQNDSRIVVCSQPRQGVAAARNRGIQHAKGCYVAWLDADDIALPERLACQVEFMESHPEVGVCGTEIKTIGHLEGAIWRYPVEDAAIRCALLLQSPFATSSVIMRRVLLADHNLHFDESCSPAEDYDMWNRAAPFSRLANLPEILVFHRIHHTQLSRTQQDKMRHNAGRIRRRQIEQLGINPTDQEFALHQAIGDWQLQADKPFVRQTDKWLRKLCQANRVTHVYPEPAFSRFMGERWFAVCRAACPHGWWTWITFWRSPLGWLARPGRRALVKFWHDTTRL